MVYNKSFIFISNSCRSWLCHVLYNQLFIPIRDNSPFSALVRHLNRHLLIFHSTFVLHSDAVVSRFILVHKINFINLLIFCKRHTKKKKPSISTLLLQLNDNCFTKANQFLFQTTTRHKKWNCWWNPTFEETRFINPVYERASCEMGIWKHNMLSIMLTII